MPRADNRPQGPSRTHLAVALQRLVRATDPKFRRGHAPRHSIRADSRALDPSPAHPTVLLPLLTRGRPSPRVIENAPESASTAPAGADRAPQGASSRPSTPIRQTLTTEGDIPRGRVRVLPSGGIRRRRGQQSRPPTRRMPPAAQKCPRTRRMSPAAAPEYGASLASRATGAPTAPAPTSNHDLRAPHRRQKRPDRGRRGGLQARRLPALRCRLPPAG